MVRNSKTLGTLAVDAGVAEVSLPHGRLSKAASARKGDNDWPCMNLSVYQWVCSGKQD